MAIFNYKALTAQGQRVNEIIEANSWHEANECLQDMGLVLLELTASTDADKPQRRFHLSRLLPARLDNLLVFTTQLATLLTAEIPIAESLATLASQTQNKRWQQIILDLRGGILEGHSFSQSLAQYPQVFSMLYCQSIAAGEQAGFLPQVLAGLTEYLEAQRSLQNKIQQALLYPLIMILVSVGVIGFLLFYVMPKIIPLFKSQHQTLPWMTKLLLDTVGFLHHQWAWLLCSFALSIFVIQKLLKQPHLRALWHRCLLKLPIIGKISLLANTTRFTSTLSFLLNAGVPLVEALANAKTLIKILPMQQAIDQSLTAVYQGQSLAHALADTPYFPALTLHLIKAGEQTGRLASMLEKAAAYHTSELNHKITMLLTLFEPLMILVMGAIVLFIVLAVLLPIFSLDQLASLH